MSADGFVETKTIELDAIEGIDLSVNANVYLTEGTEQEERNGRNGKKGRTGGEGKEGEEGKGGKGGKEGRRKGHY